VNDYIIKFSDCVKDYVPCPKLVQIKFNQLIFDLV